MKRLAVFVAALAMTGHCLAADAPNIGYVDMQQVLQESKLGKQAQEKLKEKFGPKSEEFAKEEKAIAQQKQALERDKPLMSKDQIKKKEDEIQKKIEAFQKIGRRHPAGVAEGAAEAGPGHRGSRPGGRPGPVQGEEDGHGLRAQPGGHPVYGQRLDLTKEVIKRLDEKAK